jgi:hypothetical protein
MTDTENTRDAMIAETWRHWYQDGPPPYEIRKRRVFRLLPATHRCTYCFAPFDGLSSVLVKNFL